VAVGPAGSTSATSACSLLHCLALGVIVFEGYQFAKEHGKGSEYNHCVLEASFRDGEDMGSTDVLETVGGVSILPSVEKAINRCKGYSYHSAESITS